jgi:hypothetical protein
MSASKPTRYVAAGVAAVALAFGAYAVGNAASGNGTSGVADAAGPAAQRQVPGNGQMPQGRQGRPGFGTPVAGGTAKKVKAAALAKYDGTVERVMRLPDGSYVAHVITSNGEYHVAVSKDFKVTGAQQGGFGGRGPNGAAPSGSAAPNPTS